MSTATIQLSFPSDDIAVLTLDMPDKGANILSSSVLDELDKHLVELETRDDLAGLVVISGKPGMFIAGADLREFAASMDIEREQTVAMCRRGQDLFARLSKFPGVTVAAIDGICVGGGAELAIWCDRRILSDGPKTEFGFPEVKIGLFPGWGGTVRTPRIVGLSNAIEMITGGESLKAHAAYEIGLASDVVAADRLLDAAVQLIRQEQETSQYLRDRETWSQPVSMPETELGFLGVTASAVIRQQTKGQYPAPMAALETMMEAAMVDADQACVMEAEGMSHLFGSSVNASLINVFFLTDRIKKDTGVSATELQPGAVASVGVIGAGIMGSGISAANIKRGVRVALQDMSQEAVDKGAQGALEEAAYDRELKAPSPTKLLELAPALSSGTEDHILADCDVVIEAVIENPDIKKQIFQRIEPKLKEGAILASNTSTIPITELATAVKNPERFCGIHFFNPVRRMKLVEVIRGEATNDETVVTAVSYAKRIGKLPIVVNDGPGFLVNRLLLPYMNEALELLTEGASVKDIERASKAFGLPMGPLTLYDVVGLDTALYAGKTMQAAFPDRVRESAVLSAMVAANRLGQKSGQGFFSYKNKKKKAEPDPTLSEVLQPLVSSTHSWSSEQITHRLFLPMLLEATRVLEDGIVRNARDVDFGLIFGIGFPPFKGGLMFWADTVGAAKLMEMLEPLASLGPRMEPTNLLRQLAADGGKFYDL